MKDLGNEISNFKNLSSIFVHSCLKLRLDSTFAKHEINEANDISEQIRIHEIIYLHKNGYHIHRKYMHAFADEKNRFHDEGLYRIGS
jgi:hypothetical protein